MDLNSTLAWRVHKDRHNWEKYMKKLMQKCLRNKRWNLVIPHVAAEWAQAQRLSDEYNQDWKFPLQSHVRCNYFTKLSVLMEHMPVLASIRYQDHFISLH